MAVQTALRNNSATALRTGTFPDRPLGPDLEVEFSSTWNPTVNFSSSVSTNIASFYAEWTNNSGDVIEVTGVRLGTDPVYNLFTVSQNVLNGQKLKIDKINVTFSAGSGVLSALVNGVASSYVNGTMTAVSKIEYELSASFIVASNFSTAGSSGNVVKCTADDIMGSSGEIQAMVLFGSTTPYASSVHSVNVEEGRLVEFEFNVTFN
jgi:hypothetical protein